MQQKIGGNNISKRKTHEEYVAELATVNKNIEALDKYVTAKTKITHHCLICDHKWEVTPSDILRGHGCPRCARRVDGRERFIDSIKKNGNKNISILGAYIDSKTPIECECNICNNKWSTLPSVLMTGRGCFNCAVKENGKHSRKTNEKYIEDLKMVNNTIIPLEPYVTCNDKIKHKCLICEHEWYSTPSNILHGRGCPKCGNEKSRLGSLLTHDEYLKRLQIKKCSMYPLEEYINSHTPILHQCNTCRYSYKVSPNQVLTKINCCPQCHKRIRYTTESFIQHYRQIFGFNNIEFIGEYVNNDIPIKCRCNICGYEWASKGDALLRGVGCKNCKSKDYWDKNRRTKEEFIDLLNEVTDNIEIIGDYINSGTKISCKCKICSNEWSATPTNLLRDHGCPSCHRFSGEDVVARYLSTNNIEFVHPMKYEGLVGIGGRELSYDFYLPKYNTLIEVQGKQHKAPIEWFGGEAKFKIQQEHDKRKRDFAENQNIPLLEIWYYEKDSTDDILTKFLNNLKSKSVETVIPA